jgi:hypothetical protein
MAEWIRLPNCCINLDQYVEIRLFGDEVVLISHGVARKVLLGDDASVFLQELEQRYGLMTSPNARLMQEPMDAHYEPA